MKKLILLLFIPLVSFGQGQQLYADGSAVDQDGNSFEWITYGELDWSIENANVVTYRDGTPIPQVSDPEEWSDLTTGAWCYYNNDPTMSRLYNWYAVAGIHDEDSFADPALRKKFAPEGWHVSSNADWTLLANFLIANGYNYDGTTSENKIAKALASTTGWSSYNEIGTVGYNQNLNNNSGFNAFPFGFRNIDGSFDDLGNCGRFNTSTSYDDTLPSGAIKTRRICYINNFLHTPAENQWTATFSQGRSVRFVGNTAINECPISDPLDLILCGYDGVASFDLNANDSVILNGLSSENYSIYYYETLADAESGVNAITSPYQNTSNPQTIYFGVSGEDCYSTGSFVIAVETTPENYAMPDIAMCNCDITSIIEFENNENVTYYWNADGSSSNNISGYFEQGVGNIPNMTLCNLSASPETLTYLYYSVDNVTGCASDVLAFSINVYPEIEVNRPDDYFYESGDVTDEVVFSSPNDNGTFTYSWTNDNPSIGLPSSGTGNIPSFVAINAGCSPITANIAVSTTNDIGCTSFEEAFTITVNNLSCNYETVYCDGDTYSTTFCYDTGLDNSYTFTSNDGNSLNLAINEGQVEVNWDQLEIRDSDGTVLYNGYGSNGNLAGLSFQSSGDTITLEVIEDGSISCVSYGYTPISFTVSCSGLSVDEQDYGISIYPNPTSKYINVNVSTELEAVVFDLLGKELIRENINGGLDISSLEKGTYILNLSDGTNTSTHKIIKE